MRGAYLDLSAAACLEINNGLISGEHWDVEAVHRYLKEEANLLIQIMLVMYLRGGQNPRVPELSSIECDNGPSTARGVYIHAGRVVYITRHTKARRSTNQEFHEARCLPTEDSALVAKYLVYVRPFANMLWRICHSFGHERRLLFASMENPERPWKSDVLTKALKTLMHGICGVAFGVQVYRQLSVAVTERHIKQIRRPFNKYEDKSTDADINVAFAWQSAHRPIKRGIAYGIDGAYPDLLQPALLRVYQWASEEWHKFLAINEFERQSLAASGGSASSPRSKRRASTLPKGHRATRQRRSISPPPTSSGVIHRISTLLGTQDLPSESPEQVSDRSQSLPSLQVSSSADFSTKLDGYSNLGAFEEVNRSDATPTDAILFAGEPAGLDKEDYDVNARTMPASKGETQGTDRGTRDWWKDWIERRREKIKEVLGGLDPQKFADQPDSIRLRRLRSVLTKPGWLWMLSDEVDDDMLPGIVLLRGSADENPTLQQEAWQVNFGDNCSSWTPATFASF